MLMGYFLFRGYQIYIKIIVEMLLYGAGRTFYTLFLSLTIREENEKSPASS